MTGQDILKKEKPGDLFPNDAEKAKKVYKELSKKFHPDFYKGTEGDEIFKHITELYNQALKDFQNNTWTKSNFISLETDSGKHLNISYKYHRIFEIGEYYSCNDVIVYVLNKDCDKYADNALKMVKNLSFESGKMQEFKNFLPIIKIERTLRDGRRCIVYEKARDMHPLSAILNYYHGNIPHRHVAWIVNRLSNLACYFQFSEIVHNGINIENIFISPDKHAAAIMGGWWYAVPDGAKMIGTTKDIFDVMPVTARNSKQAKISTDLESIKLVGRTILGEKQQRKLSLMQGIPKPLIQFMIDGSGESAFDEFEKYNNALDKAYGKRVFVKMDINYKDVYKNK